MPAAPGKARENRESVQPSGRAAQRWTVERRRKTRQNADRCSRPARDQKPWLAAYWTPTTGNQKPRKPGAGPGRTPPDGQCRPYAGFGRLRRYFGSAQPQPTEEAGSAPGRGTPARAPRTRTFWIIGCGPTGNPERSPLSIWNSPAPAPGLAFGKAASRPVKPGGGSPGRYTPRLTTRPVFGKALSGAKSAPPKAGLSAGRENARLRTPRGALRPDVYRGFPFVSRQCLRYIRGGE